MSNHIRQLVTIITEAVLESELTRLLERLGARGYTITEARGKGSRGIRDAGWDEVRNLRLEVLCDEAVADARSLLALVELDAGEPLPVLSGQEYSVL